jgi:conjugal transfer/entry exclusion protein
MNLSQSNRDSESINSQINQIQQIISILENELSQASSEEKSI